MHSSRMRTAGFSGCLSGGECLPVGCLPRVVCTTPLAPLQARIHPLAHFMLGYTPLLRTEEMTHACVNITFPQLLLRAVITTVH